MEKKKRISTNHTVPEVSFRTGFFGIDLSGETFCHKYLNMDPDIDTKTLHNDILVIGQDFKDAAEEAIKEYGK